MQSPRPIISIIIPARDEEKLLPKCLDSIAVAAAKIPEAEVEIVVVLNRCTDRTEQIALEYGCRVTNSDAKNLSIIRNSGAREARGEIIVTIDADSTMSPNMLRAVLRNLTCDNIVGGGVMIVAERISLGILLTALCLVPMVVRHGISAGLFYCRKTDFDAIGGFNEELVSLEDIDFARRLKLHGRKTQRRFKTIFDAVIRTSCRKFDQFGDWYFLRHPKFFRALLNGRNEKAANRYWYDFGR